MKLQSIALGLALAMAGSAFAATVTQERTVTRVTPRGTVTRHIVSTAHRPVNRVVVVNHHRPYHRVNRVVVVHPAHHHYAANRTVVIHRNNS
ncbi:hypothetical protein [Ramlibacter sp.]|uniref:hypothetical protein n=1 Tax=Ramlibacter sp. TaxID=1917967 RepID=UPI00261E59B5|nr:hypothetical protein [Ramlibacter sp.]MDB5957950.1 hypothetical protein [Ramlibacter sp.]